MLQVLHELTGTDELYVDCEVVNHDDHYEVVNIDDHCASIILDIMAGIIL